MAKKRRERISSSIPTPPPDTDLLGRHWTGRLRIRPSWFFGLLIAEEFVEHDDGRGEWVRIWRPHEICSVVQAGLRWPIPLGFRFETMKNLGLSEKR